MRNQKGMATVGIVFWAIFATGALGSLTLGRGQHIVKRAEQKCVADGKDDLLCHVIVDNMTQDERIEYIRDK